jgi:hypothetical protein
MGTVQNNHAKNTVSNPHSLNADPDFLLKVEPSIYNVFRILLRVTANSPKQKLQRTLFTCSIKKNTVKVLLPIRKELGT